MPHPPLPPASASPPSAPPPPAPRWTIVFPVYNEEKRIGATLERVAAYLAGRGEPFEIIVVDDGSADGTAALVASRFPKVRILRNPENRGKGFSVRTGLLAAEGGFVLFSDADLSTPIEEMEGFQQHLESGAEVVIASRALPGSRIELHQAWWREWGGRFFNRLVRWLSGLPYHDTQCGFKAYRRVTARRIAGLQRLDGWAFDVEQLHLARLLGLRVVETPVRWVNSPDSRVRFLRDAGRMFRDILRIRSTRYDLSGRAGE